MKKIICPVAFFYCLLVVCFIHDAHAVIYKYINKEGIVCFADDLQAVPRQYRATALIVEGEDKENPAQSPGPLTVHTEPQATASPEEPAFRGPRPFSFRLLISATVSLTGVFIFIVLSKQVWLKENKKAESIARALLVGIVSVYLIIVHAKDVMTIFGIAGKAIDDIQQQSAEKGKKAAQAIKTLDAVFQEAQKAQEGLSGSGANGR